MVFYQHQKKALKETEGLRRVAYYHEQGLGKTFTGAEKLIRMKTRVNLLICQKSKIDDWVDHFKKFYKVHAVDITDKHGFIAFWEYQNINASLPIIGIINYELAFRRPELKNLEKFTLMLDESSLIQNEHAKRSEFILSLRPANVILLSGTPTSGKYERLWSQLKLLGWAISKEMFYNHYVDYHYDNSNGFPLMIIDGYKNVDRLKKKMREYGCNFLKTEDCIDLPEQIEQTIRIKPSTEYRKFRKDRIVQIGKTTLVGDTTLTKMLYERQLCGMYSDDKLEAFRDLLESTSDRVIVFYNFWKELHALKGVCDALERPVSVVNGTTRDLVKYETESDSVTFIQYQAGAMGLNLQKAFRVIYYTPPLSSELMEQSKKRIHRIGQKHTCFYYYLTVTGSIEEQIYNTLAIRADYTEQLFIESENTV